MIEARQLRKDFGPRIAVQDVSLHVAAGEKLVVLGPSGCGKTTFLRMLNRLVEPTSGEVLFNGVDTKFIDPVELRRQMGYVIHGAGLLPHRTVRENILTVPRLLGWSDEKCDDTLFVMKAILWLFDDWLDAYPHELSAGQKQRVAVARALITDPPVVLMDEPFSTLDPITRTQVRREIRGLWALRNKAIVMITHDVTEALEFADRIALMASGQIEQLGTPAELLFNPRTEFVRHFFDGDRLHYEWQAVHVQDLDLPNDPLQPDQPPTKLGLSFKLTMAEAMTAVGHKIEQSMLLTAAFQKFKRAAAAAGPAQIAPR